MQVYIRYDDNFVCFRVASVKLEYPPCGRQVHITLLDGVTYVLRHFWGYRVKDDGKFVMIECYPHPDDLAVIDMMRGSC